MSLTIRPYAPADLEALHRIRAEAFAPIFASFRSIVGVEISAVALATAEKEQAELLERLCAAGEVHVAERDGAPIGFVAVTLDRAQLVGELGLNAVLPSEAGHGVGHALHQHALDIMRREGMRVAFVGAGGDASHAAARRAYEKAGFVVGIPSITLYRML